MLNSVSFSAIRDLLMYADKPYISTTSQVEPLRKMVTKGDTVTKTFQIMNKLKSKKRKKLVINVRNLL